MSADFKIQSKEFYEIVEHYYTEKCNGRDFTSIRKELEGKGVSNEIISQIIKEVDKRYLASYINKESRSSVFTVENLGFFLAFVGTVSGLLSIFFRQSFMQMELPSAISFLLGVFIVVERKHKGRNSNKSYIKRKFGSDK